MPAVSRERLAEVFVEVADTLVDDFDLIEFLSTVTVRAAELTGVADADLRQATARWPAFAPHAARLGFRSVHAIPLRLRRRVIGALSLFGTDTGGLDPDGGLKMAHRLEGAGVVTVGLANHGAGNLDFALGIAELPV